MNDSTKPLQGASAEAIEHHYGTGNEYFKLWLDETMTYSCAMWDPHDPEQSLAAAQRHKIDYHIEQAHAKNATCVLDIGCGWGSVLTRLITQFNCKSAVGLTLSKSQAEWIAQTNSDPGISVKLQSWNDHDAPDSAYDSIISIGAFEHFAKLGQSSEEKVRIYREFFSKCQKWLRSHGWMSLQTVAYGNSLTRDFDPFIAKQIFPETDTPRLKEIAEGAERLFEVVHLRNDRDDYRRTLRAWFSRLKSRRADAISIRGEEEVKKFEQYLRLMAYMFEVGGLDLYRITLRKIDNPKS